AADARAARARQHLSPLRLPERHARALERMERPRTRLPLEARVRRRRALRHPALASRPGHLLAAPEGLPLAAEGEVRDPGLPPARLLLRARIRDDSRRARPRD